jgi:hypothetical protein
VKQLAKLLILFISLNACSLFTTEKVRESYDGPVYVIDVANKGAQRSTREKIDCEDPKNSHLCFTPFESLDNFFCLPPEEAGLILRSLNL